MRKIEFFTEKIKGFGRAIVAKPIYGGYMLNYRWFLMICSLLISGSLSAEPHIQQAKSSIDEVLLYSLKAKVKRSASIKLLSGQSRIRLAVLPTQVDRSSVQVDSKSATIESIELASERGRLPRQAEAEELLSKLEVLHDQIHRLVGYKQILLNQRSFIRSLRLHPPYKREKKQVEGIFAGTWSKILIWLNQQSRSIAKDIKKLDREIDLLEEKRQKLIVQADSLDLNAVNREQLVINAIVKANIGVHRFHISYMVGNIKWRPSYDLRYNSKNRKVEAIYYADVEQRTGEDWKGAKLRFSTAQATQLTAIPELSTWTLGRKRDFTPKPRPRYEPAANPWKPRPQSFVHNQTVVRLRSLMQQSPKSGQAIGSTQGNLSGTYPKKRYTSRSRPRRSYKKKAYKRKRYDDLNDDLDDASKSEVRDEEKALPPPSPKVDASVANEVMAEPSVQRSRRRDYRKAKPGAPSLPWTDQGYQPPYLPYDAPAKIAEGYIFTLYAPGQHTVLADGKRNRIPMKHSSFKIKPIYQIVPGKSKHAYLMAKMQNNTGHPILRGSANLFSGSMFSGKSEIKTALPGRKLDLPLGVDESIKVVRHIHQKTLTKGVLFKDDLSEYRVDIEIANHRNYSVTVDLHDQIPVARGKKVKVEHIRYYADDKNDRPNPSTYLERKEGWTAANENGKLYWKGNIAANKVKKLSFSFRIKRPKDWHLTQQGG